MWLVARIAWNQLLKYIQQYFPGGVNPFGYDTGSQDGRRSSSFYNRDSKKRRRKKIDADTGEYVDFEEIEVDREAELRTQYQTVEYQQQQQVSDAEWEEIR